MRHRLRHYWHEFRTAEAGQRFRERYARRERERSSGGSQWSRIVLIGIALLCLVIAVPLMILPGPAVLFYALAGFLVAGESAWMAALFDRIELLLRRLFKRPGQKRLK